jgi:high-affinity K+ transport system ATPase subunit B
MLGFEVSLFLANEVCWVPLTLGKELSFLGVDRRVELRRVASKGMAVEVCQIRV